MGSSCSLQSDPSSTCASHHNGSTQTPTPYTYAYASGNNNTAGAAQNTEQRPGLGSLDRVSGSFKTKRVYYISVLYVMIALDICLTDLRARLIAIIASMLFCPIPVSCQQLLRWLPYANWI